MEDHTVAEELVIYTQFYDNLSILVFILDVTHIFFMKIDQWLMLKIEGAGKNRYTNRKLQVS